MLICLLVITVLVLSIVGMWKIFIAESLSVGLGESGDGAGIALLQVYIVVFTLGMALLAIFGYNGLRNLAKRTAIDALKDPLENFNTNADKVISRAKELASEANTVLQKANTVMDVTMQEEKWKRLSDYDL